MRGARQEQSLSRRGSRTREARPTRPEAQRGAVAGPDWGYVIALVMLISVGLIMVYSTTAAKGGIKDLAKMGIWLGLGIPGMWAAMRLPMQFWRKLAPWLLVVCVVLLGSLLLGEHNPMAITTKGATRWLKLPGGFSFQPSELAKFAFVLFAAKFLDRRGRKMGGDDWLVFLGVMGGLAGLIYLEPDLGTALVLAGIAFCMLIAAGVSLRKMLVGVLVAAVLVGALAWSRDHQRKRLLAWWNPWAEQFRQDDGYQVVQSWVAMSRGGLWGVGLGRSTQKLPGRLPEANTDFIFAIVSEELGMIRAIGMLMLFGLLAWRGYGIAARAPDRYSGLVVTGITSWIAVQSCLNVAVATGTVPNTGVPLPFISAGGTSLTMLMVATGVVVGISRRRPAPVAVPAAAPATASYRR